MLIRSLPVLLVVVGLLLRAKTAVAAPSVEGPRCRVSLSKLSYDDPGSDDAEFVELSVERTPESVADAGSLGDGALTLGECGLAAIELVDGQGGACNVYRSIPLADVVVPDDDVVLLCATDAAFTAKCDVTAAGRSALKASWLQNGPSDGLRLISLSGAAVEIGYEPPPACFAQDAIRLADESPAEVDDVSALCDGRYVLLASKDAPLRLPAACPRPNIPDPVDGAAEASPSTSSPVPSSSPSSPAPGSGVPDSSGELDASYVPERAPTPRESPSKDDGLFRTDGGARTTPDLRGVPRPPGCATRRLPLGGAGGTSAWAFLALASVRIFRRRRRRPFRCSPAPLRAGSCARCGSGPSRSPSR